MSSKSLQLLEIDGAKDLEELKRLLRENFESIKLLMDGLTGERLEDWTPVLRDGSVSMTGDLSILGGSLKLKDSAGSDEVAWRSGGGGVLEHRDNVSAEYTPVYDPEYHDVTDERELDTVYKNKNKTRFCQITLKLEP